jgi:hypothetical protein
LIDAEFFKKMGPQLINRKTNDLKKGRKALTRKVRLIRSYIIQIALEKFIGELKGSEKTKPYDRVANIIGTISGGIPDLGEAHRKHLLEKMRNLS